MKSEVSVIIPTVGGRNSIIDSIESIITQKNVKTEIIIVFDHKPVDLSLKEKYKNIILIKNTGNKGGNACRNLGVSVSKYDIVAFLDDDDTWVNNKLDKQLEILSKYSINTVVYTGKNIVTVSNSKIKSRYSFFKKPKALAIDSLAIRNFVGSTSSIILNKSIFNKVKGFNEGLVALQDYELYIRLAKHNVDFVGINEPLINYYIVQNKSSVSKKFNKNLISSFTVIRLFESFKNKIRFAYNTIIIYNIKVLFHKIRFI